MAWAKGTGEPFSCTLTEKKIGKFSGVNSRSPPSITATKLKSAEKLAVPGHNHQGFVDIVARLTEELGTFEAPLPQELPAKELNAGDAARLEELATSMVNRTGGGLSDV